MVTVSSTGTAETTQTSARPTVFFDGSCPLCSAEIATYRKCRGADEIDWVDVAHDSANEGTDIVAPGLTRKAALRRFHVRRADGTIRSGGAAFAELWAALPALSWVGRIGQRRPVTIVLEGAYRLFLPIRPLLQRWFQRRHQRHIPPAP
jgi:predicted DCC family thiol-disulfide oxidoreductase YuxK